MRWWSKFLGRLNVVDYYQNMWFFCGVLFGVVIDLYLLYTFFFQAYALAFNTSSIRAVAVPELLLLVVFCNTVMCSVLSFISLYNVKRKYFLLHRTLQVILFIAVIFFSIVVTITLITKTFSLIDPLNNVSINIFPSYWLLNAAILKCLGGLVFYLLYKIGQKYTPGFFMNMTLGWYSTPRTEKRIIMFIDLKDSTPISEKLGHQQYFLFISDFIYSISRAALANKADIYQYVGDEVIVTWPLKKRNSTKCMETLILSRKNIARAANAFKKSYGIVPEFRVGVHIGEVTIGQIGVIKKDIAMSGEAMNITARIRSCCSELNRKEIVSEEYFNYTNLKQWQGEDLGVIPLKGVEKEQLRLFSLKI